MAVLRHPLFGEIDLSVDTDWFGRITHAGRPLPVSVLFEGDGADGAFVAKTLSVLDRLDAADEAACAAIRADAGADAATPLYRAHHADVLGAGAGLDELLARLRLVAIAFHFGDSTVDDVDVVFDYSIGPDVTNYILAVTFSPDGQVVGVDMES